VPLPFLTAHRVTEDGSADEAVQPYEDPGRWRRPYRPGPWRVGGAALVLLLASYVLFSSMIIGLAGSLPGAGGCVAVAVLLIAFAVRMLRVGVRVSEHGLRQCGFFATTTVAWSEVAAVRTYQQPVRWLGSPRIVQGQALVVTVTGARRLGPVVTDRSADFLRRPEGFDAAADAIEAWAARYR
jgi:hypothetical protein